MASAQSIYYPTGNGYFSGAGILEMGAQDAGVRMLQSIDIDLRATEHMKRNPKYFSHKIINADIRDLTVLDQPESDIMFFTFPCTRYSTIADIHGVRTGDEMFLHSLRHVALRRPEMYVVENVPGMKKFPVVMEAMSKLPGYYYNIFCPLNASNWVPQNRKRLILIATKKSFFLQEPQQAKNRPTIKDILEPDADLTLQPYVIKRLKGGYRDKPIIVDPDDPDALAPTCVAHYAKDRGTRLVKDKRSKYGVRSFTLREWARLQGIPDDVVFEDTPASFQLIGNAVEFNMGRWIGQAAMSYFNNKRVA